MDPAKPVSVKSTELRDAFEFVSVGTQYEQSAYIDSETGKIYLASLDIDLEEELPEDIETSDRYIAVPHKHELDLGRSLVFSFVARELPQDYDAVHGIFRRKGAYRRFKDLLESRGVLQSWYDFENNATEQALREWCEENSIQLVEG